MKKDTFIIRTDWYESIKMLPQDQKAILLDLFFLHHISDDENNLTENLIENLKKPNGNLNNLLVIGFWNLIKPQLQAASDKYSKKLETSKQNGKLGGRPSKEKKPNENLTENLNENLKKPKKPYMNMSMDMSMENEYVYVNDDEYENAQSETKTKPKTIDEKLNQIDPACVGVANWFRRIAYPIDKKHLYSDIISDDDVVTWATQWCEICRHPSLVKYYTEERNRPFAAYDDHQNVMQPFLQTLVEFAFVIKRDTYGEYFKDLTYLIQERNGKLNIDNLATAYQRWLAGEEKKTRDMFPTLGN